jgi:hypothetical protein
MSVFNQNKTVRQTLSNRQFKVGKWNIILKTSDINQIWAQLHRIVSSHPLVRASKSAGLLIEEGNRHAYTDLTQELFVSLLSKERFQHYLDTGMSDTEIEAEISQLELTNLLTVELRRRYPESYRLARRVSTLIQNKGIFKRFDNIDNPGLHRRLADRIFGLSEWSNRKMRRSMQEMEERVKLVSFLSRDTRKIGCTGDVQIIITNADLEKLIVRVFRAIDSPADVRSLRSFVISRLPVMDIYLVPIGGTTNNDESYQYELDPADIRENPEENYLRREGETLAADFVEGFLTKLNKTVRGKAKQYERMINVLWLCYLTSDRNTQLEVAEMLGVSDSLISVYRKHIEANLQALPFDGLNEARQFEKVLRRKVSQIISVEKHPAESLMLPEKHNRQLLTQASNNLCS